MSAAVVGAALGSAVGGMLSDRVGRKRALLAGDALFAAGALLMGLAQSAAALIAGARSAVLPRQLCVRARVLRVRPRGSAGLLPWLLPPVVLRRGHVDCCKPSTNQLACLLARPPARLCESACLLSRHASL